MDKEQELIRKFGDIGARAEMRPAVGLQGLLNVVRGHFDIAGPRQLLQRLEVVDAKPKLRHLLLMSKDEQGKHKFLCGHDERHWFVAAIPESARGVRDVLSAMEALKPERVREAQVSFRIKNREKRARKNDAYVRQGEWFFVPVQNRRLLKTLTETENITYFATSRFSAERTANHTSASI